jgi:hypothetical protein
MSRHPILLATITGVLVFGVYVAFDLAIRHEGPVQATTAGALTGIVFACAIWYGLRKRGY